jgi:peptidoglycan/LPS O-acetylase OafA/YrhL
MPSSASIPTPESTREAADALLDAASSPVFTLRDLDVKDTTILKGLSIIAIVLHNFFHVLGPTHQNEFTFQSSRFPLFLHVVLQPSLAIQALFTFFGHFGVQIFIFLSAYGLAKSHWDDQSSWPAFMWGRIKKLYPVILLVVLPWFIFTSMDVGAAETWHQFGPEFVCMLLGISTLMGFALPLVGPWWFIPFIVQFYALWIPIRSVAKKAGWQGLVALAVISLLALYVSNPLLGRWNINLLHTPFGRMANLCLGIAAARYPIRFNGLSGAILALSGAIVLVLGSNYYAFFPLSPIGASLVLLWSYAIMRRGLGRIVLLELVGRYSMLMFLLNGLVRIPFLDLATSPARQLIYGAVTLGVTFLIAGMIHELLLNPHGLRSAFRSPTKRPQAS